ncbi:hypothetical protein I5907_18065 [Panacibacter sp. DH6]|uniref:Uncharacterized protein n=1 Tax=Panacibacter microcysteis TaxID=2793269 RepID=A0A931GZC5_9BACT|nr:hypothetical protein [Panacibacter microcysteis]MBG9378149.1 hypothetical protein [Panacibacter microcysteis]
MKKGRILLIVIISVFAMLYAFAYLFVIPNAAEASMPHKWKYVFADLKQREYHVYLGSTAAGEAEQAFTDNWVVNNGNYTYYLDIHYDKDTIADRINMRYTFKNFLFSKEGEITTARP